MFIINVRFIAFSVPMATVLRATAATVAAVEEAAEDIIRNNPQFYIICSFFIVVVSVHYIHCYPLYKVYCFYSLIKKKLFCELL
jgi:hypothetical protein